MVKMMTIMQKPRGKKKTEKQQATHWMEKSPDKSFLRNHLIDMKNMNELKKTEERNILVVKVETRCV
jgi:hypothetical protein